MTACQAIETDVAIIGAGPSGLFAVFACGQLGMRCAVIDALSDVGGQLVALYPEKPIYDIPAHREIRADALINDLMFQIAPYQPELVLGSPAVDLEEASDRFTVRTEAGQEVQAKAVILAAGPGAFGPNRPPLPNIREYEGSAVFYHVRRREDFRGKRVVIAGGGDSAVDWANALAAVAESVAVVHRRKTFRAAPAQVDQMMADDRITLHLGWQIAGLEGNAPTLDHVILSSMTGETTRIKADTLVPLFGLASDLSALSNWGVALTGKTATVDPATCETTRRGVYAIGDLAAYPGKRKLILTGFAEAAMAAEAAYARVFPGKALHHEHSTTRGAPSALTAEGPSTPQPQAQAV